MNDNPHLKRLDELEKTRKLWQESERILKILRAETGKPLKDPTDEEILQWDLQNNQVSQ